MDGRKGIEDVLDVLRKLLATEAARDAPSPDSEMAFHLVPDEELGRLFDAKGGKIVIRLFATAPEMADALLPPAASRQLAGSPTAAGLAAAGGAEDFWPPPG